MNQLWTSVLIILSFAVLGFFTGQGFKRPLLKRSQLIARINTLVLWLLIAAMGYRLGADQELLSRLGSLGLTALVLTLTTSAGSITLALILGRVTSRRTHTQTNTRTHTPAEPQHQETIPSEPLNRKSSATPFNRLHLLKDPMQLLTMMILGALLGWWQPELLNFDQLPITEILLYILLFFAGLGMSLENSGGFRKLLHVNTLLLPLATALGSLAGGIVSALVLNMPLARGLAAAAGFGWYSLSGVLITDLGDAFLGNAAFLSNLLRESLALLTIPIMASAGWTMPSISIAGATSMDVTLPMISRYNGYQVMGLAMVHGVILSILVPLLVPLFMAVPIQ